MQPLLESGKCGLFGRVEIALLEVLQKCAMIFGQLLHLGRIAHLPPSPARPRVR